MNRYVKFNICSRSYCNLVGILVESDQPIVVQGLSTDTTMTDAFLVPQLENLGTEYIAFTHWDSGADVSNIYTTI